jgi:WD40 repeat protein
MSTLKPVDTLLQARSSSYFGGTTDSTTYFAINNDGTILAVGASDLTTVSIFIKSDGQFKSSATFISHQYVRSIAFHPLFPVLATGSKDGTVKLWRIMTDGKHQNSATQDLKFSINSVAFHPSLPFLATG